MEKKYVAAGVTAVITGIVLAVIVIMAAVKPVESKFDRYEDYASQVGVTDWTISQDTAESFADANCDKLKQGAMPLIGFRNENHVKSSAAVLAAYCPDAFDNFLAGVIMNYPQYRDTAMYVNERLHVDSR